MSFNRFFLSCIYIVGSLMIATPSWGQTPVTVTFDEISPPTITSFGGGVGTIEVPVPADTGGGTEKALKIVRNGPLVYAGAWVAIPEILNSAGNQTVTARVYSPTAGIPFVAKAEYGENTGTGDVAANEAVVVGWQTLTWTMPVVPGNAYNRFVVLPHLGTPGAGETYFIDNVSYTALDTPDPMQPYSQNFDGLGEADPSALSADGWLAFTNVSDYLGGYKFGFGPDPAPNVDGGSAFSRIVTGQGGAPQGTQQLNVFNNYDCCSGSGEGHFNTPSDIVEANVYQERILTSADENQTYVVRFDAKKGNIGGNTTANWFMKTFIPFPFFQSSFESVDMTGLPGTWGTYCVQLTVPAGTAGQSFQFGYSSTASNFDPSGNFVDNIAFGTPADIGEVDTDNDGVVDCADPDDDNDGILDPYDGPGVDNECTADVEGNATLDAETISGARTCAAQESVDVKNVTTVTGTGNATVIAPLVVLTDVGIELNGQATFINDSCQGAGCPVAAPTGNIAINGGFETGAFNDGSTNASWQQFPNGGTQTIVTTNPSEGTYAANLVVPPRGATDPAVDNLIKNANLQAGFLPDGANITVTWDMRGSLVGAGGVVFVELFSEKAGGGTNKAEIYTGGPIFPVDPNNWTPYLWNTTIANTAEGGAPGGVTLQLKVSCGPVEGCGADIFFDNVTITLP